MVCKTCGCKLNENDKFCRYCGTTAPAAPQQNAAPQQSAPAPQSTQRQTTYTPGQSAQATRSAYAQGQGAQAARPAGKGAYAKPAGSNKPRKSKKGLIIGGGIAAAVLVIALVVVLIVMNDPTVKVGTAFKNTADALAKIGEVWHAEEVTEFSRKEAVSLSMDMKIDSVSEDLMYYYSDALAGLGVKVDVDTDLENREMGVMASAYLGSTDLITMMISAEDDMLYLGAPDFLNDFYGFSTETIMRELDDMGAGLGEAADISFNIFELLEIMNDYSGNAEENQQAILEAATALVQEIQIEKGSKDTIKVGGESLKCQGYTVTIPQDALEDWFGTIEDIGTVDTVAMMEELFEAMSLPEDIVEELMYDFEYSYAETDYSEVYEMLDMLADIELQVYVKSSKIAGIVYEEKIEDTKVEVGLYIGGERYADCIELEVKVGDEKVTIESEGDHTAKDGVFTDEITIKAGDGKVTIETEYDPESGALAVNMGNDYPLLVLEGTYTVSESSYLLELDELTITEDGTDLMSLSLSYEITDYEKRVRVSDARIFSDLTDADFSALYEEVEGNAMEWAMELATNHPELLGLLGLY